MAVTRKNPHIGSSLDALLEEDGALAAALAAAVKRVLAFRPGHRLCAKGFAAGRINRSSLSSSSS